MRGAPFLASFARNGRGGRGRRRGTRLFTQSTSRHLLGLVPFHNELAACNMPAMNSWGQSVALASALATVLMFFLYLVQYRKGKQRDGDKLFVITVRALGFGLAALIVLMLIFHKQVAWMMGPEHQTTTYVTPSFTLPTVVIRDNTTRYSDSEAGSGTIGPSPEAAYQPPPNPLSISVPANTSWTSTGIVVEKGQLVSIHAGGEITVSDHDPPRSPDGSGEPCGINRNVPFVAPGLPCHSLIGRIDGSPPFEVGRSREFRAGESGTLALGVNDNWFGDNHGFWRATVFIRDNKSPK
jgi:hypothetical protein